MVHLWFKLTDIDEIAVYLRKIMSTIRTEMQEQVLYLFCGPNCCNYIDITRCLNNCLRNHVKGFVSYAWLFRNYNIARYNTCVEHIKLFTANYVRVNIYWSFVLFSLPTSVCETAQYVSLILRWRWFEGIINKILRIYNVAPWSMMKLNDL